MQDKLGPISDLVAELKKKKPMTQSEEIDLLQTLEFFSRDMDSGEMNIFVNGVRDQLEESISNKGVEKGIDLSEIKKAATRTKARIKEYCDRIGVSCGVFDTLVNATNACYEKAVHGNVVLLSPACASWDQYKKFEDRGDEFKNTIKSFKGE